MMISEPAIHNIQTWKMMCEITCSSSCPPPSYFSTFVGSTAPLLTVTARWSVASQVTWANRRQNIPAPHSSALGGFPPSLPVAPSMFSVHSWAVKSGFTDTPPSLCVSLFEQCFCPVCKFHCLQILHLLFCCGCTSATHFLWHFVLNRVPTLECSWWWLKGQKLNILGNAVLSWEWIHGLTPTTHCLYEPHWRLILWE